MSDFADARLLSQYLAILENLTALGTAQCPTCSAGPMRLLDVRRQDGLIDRHLWCESCSKRVVAVVDSTKPFLGAQLAGDSPMSQALAKETKMCGVAAERMYELIRLEDTDEQSRSG